MFTRIYWGLILATIGILFVALIVTVGSYDTAPQALYAAAANAAASGQLALQNEATTASADTGFAQVDKVQVANIQTIVQEVFDANVQDMGLVKSGYSGLQIQTNVTNGEVFVTASGTYFFPLLRNAIDGLFDGEIGVIGTIPITVYAAGV
jgi:hypothetical protein